MGRRIDGYDRPARPQALTPVRKWLGVALIGGLLIVASCRSAPIYDVIQARFTTQRDVSMAELGKLIRMTAAERGWTAKRIGRGRIEARISARNHLAVVRIAFTRQHFSVTYKDSRNLNYDGSSIHAKYNSWVRNLANDIRANAGGL